MLDLSRIPSRVSTVMLCTAWKRPIKRMCNWVMRLFHIGERNKFQILNDSNNVFMGKSKDFFFIKAIKEKRAGKIHEMMTGNDPVRRCIAFRGRSRPGKEECGHRMMVLQMLS